MINQNIQETLSRYKEVARERWDKTVISILVFGPNTNHTTLGAKLRSYIIQQCPDYCVTVRCEHTDFITNHRSMLGENKNLVFAELDAAHFVDAIIIIPDSPGSFVELGMLSPCKPIHEKVLILFKHKYADDNSSFVHEGPKLAFTENHATIKYVNYRKKRSTWQEIKPFLQKKKADRYERSILSDLT